MKRQTNLSIFLVLLLSWGYTHAQAPKSNDLLGKIHGTWIISTYQSKITTASVADTLIFQPDGTFKSTGTYFGNKRGLFTTDETRSVVIIEFNDEKKEWFASIRKNTLHLKSIEVGKKGKKLFTLTKLKEEKISK